MEIWKAIVGYEGVYEVSNEGRVKRADRILKAALKNGYPGVTLSADGNRKYVLIHSLVATAFIGPYPPRHQVNHKDGNKENNKPGNLEYVTAKENVIHAISVFGQRSLKGEKQPNSKLLESDIPKIFRLHREGLNNIEISKKFGVVNSRISEILNGKAWKHVTPSHLLLGQGQNK